MATRSIRREFNFHTDEVDYALAMDLKGILHLFYNRCYRCLYVLRSRYIFVFNMYKMQILCVREKFKKNNENF